MRRLNMTETQCNCLVVFFVTAVLLTLSPVVSFAQNNSGLQITASNPDAGAASLHTLQFITSDSLAAAAVLEVDYPAGFDLSNVTIAGSDAINGGLDVVVAGSTVSISRTGKGDVLAPGNLDLKYAVVGNAANPDSYNISLRIRPGEDEAIQQTMSGTIVTTQGQ
jgi:hypothetical protein